MLRKLQIYMAVLVFTAVLVPGAMAFSKDSLVWKKCTGCHEPVAGKIPRVEDIRTTPEEWTVIVDRMSRLHGMDLAKPEMDRLLKELCATQMLSPAELEKVAYLNLLNNPQHVEQPNGPAEEKLFVTCVRCHSAGKIFSYRMTPTAWTKVRDFHLYMIPTTVNQMREMKWVKEADTVLASLVTAYPYGAKWQTSKEKPAGSWLILGYEPGKGDYRGSAAIKSSGNDDYVIEGKVAFADGTSENFSGEGTLYGGHAFRTRTVHDGIKGFGAYAFTGGQLKGMRHLQAPDFRTSSSTWFPLEGKPQVLKVSPAFMLAGDQTRLVLEGVRLPDVTAGDITFSSGAVQIVSAKRIGPEAIEVVAISREKKLTKATIGVHGADAVPLTLAAQIDSISITPEIGRARIYGGKNFPAEGVQFDAIAFAQEGKDSISLGPVPATFKLVAQNKRPNDDDLQYVGVIQPRGKYLPTASYDPLPTREYGTEGSGIVTVEAEYVRGERRYAAKAQLVSTLPDFIPRIK